MKNALYTHDRRMCKTIVSRLDKTHGTREGKIDSRTNKISMSEERKKK